jgi:hypothetical protein
MTLRARTLAVAALLAAAGCASSSGGGRADAEPFSSARATTVRLVVQNRNFQDARLYTHRRGSRTYIGVVGGKRDQDFVLDWDFPDPMYVEIDMLAGPRCLTREMMVDPGDVLELQIAAVFSATAACR